MAELEAELLIALAHGRLLRVLSNAAGEHYDGLTSATRLLRKAGCRWSARTQRRLMQLDVAAALVRHITKASVDELFGQVQAELATSQLKPKKPMEANPKHSIMPSSPADNSDKNEKAKDAKPKDLTKSDEKPRKRLNSKTPGTKPSWRDDKEEANPKHSIMTSSPADKSDKTEKATKIGGECSDKTAEPTAASPAAPAATEAALPAAAAKDDPPRFWWMGDSELPSGMKD